MNFQNLESVAQKNVLGAVHLLHNMRGGAKI